MKTTMVTAEILLTEWKGASGTDAYRLFHKKITSDRRKDDGCLL